MTVSIIFHSPPPPLRRSILVADKGDFRLHSKGLKSTQRFMAPQSINGKDFLFTFGPSLKSSSCYLPMSGPGAPIRAPLACCSLSHFPLILDCNCLDTCPFSPPGFRLHYEKKPVILAQFFIAFAWLNVWNIIWKRGREGQRDGESEEKKKKKRKARLVSR